MQHKTHEIVKLYMIKSMIFFFTCKQKLFFWSWRQLILSMLQPFWRQSLVYLPPHLCFYVRVADIYAAHPQKFVLLMLWGQVQHQIVISNQSVLVAWNILTWNWKIIRVLNYFWIIWIKRPFIIIYNVGLV